MSLVEDMADKEPVWSRLVKRHDLRPIPYRDIASWAFGDGMFTVGSDLVQSTIKLRKAGFPDCEDTEEMFLRLFAQLRRERYIP